MKKIRHNHLTAVTVRTSVKAAAVLAVLVFLSVNGPPNLIMTVSAAEETGGDRVGALSLGPGRSELPYSDSHGDFQWALLNNGIFKLIPDRQLKPGEILLWNAGKAHVADDDMGPYKEIENTVCSVPGMDIHILPAWKKYGEKKEKRQVIVALIDTGVDYNHEDLKDSIWVNEGELAGDGIDNDKNGFVDDVHGWNFYSDNNQVFVGEEDYHGTHSAGTISAQRNNKGIAGIGDPAFVKVMVLKALGSEKGTGTPESVVRAIRYAQANGASICNLSFGTPAYNDELYQTMKQSDMLFVVSSGNGDFLGNGLDLAGQPLYPASFDLDNVITVANLQFDGTLDPSSNFGSGVELAAPGSFILSTMPGGRYGFLTGTSMAAPMVTGAAALLYSYDSGLSLADVRRILLTSARKLDSLHGKVDGSGMLDVSAAVDLADQAASKGL